MFQMSDPIWVRSRVPSPICLGSVSPALYKVALRKSPTEPWTAPKQPHSLRKT
jgi:hypothetical protein